MIMWGSSYGSFKSVHWIEDNEKKFKFSYNGSKCTKELFVKCSKKNTKTLCLLKMKNKELGVGSQPFHMHFMGECTIKIEDKNSMKKGQK